MRNLKLQMHISLDGYVTVEQGATNFIWDDEMIKFCAIAEHFDTTRQAVSKHLRILTECERIKQEHKGREIYYQLEVDKMKEIDKWPEQFRKIWETRFNQLDNLLATIKND